MLTICSTELRVAQTVVLVEFHDINYMWIPEKNVIAKEK